VTFIDLVEGTKGYIFMRSPNNVIFTAIQALFDKTSFLKCPNMCRPGYTPVGLPPDDLQSEHNGPPDNENEDYGGGDLPPLPPIPYQPMALQGPPAVNQQPPPPSPATSGKGSPVLSYKDDDVEDAWSWSPKIKSPSPLVSSKPNPPSTPSSSRPNPPVTPQQNPSENYWSYA
jgi:hypothetical protein